jgi:cell filamentation protein
VNGRYDAGNNPEGQFQPGSDGRVLHNRLGITDPDEVDRIELDLLSDIQYRLYDEIKIDQKITANDLRRWHRDWLGQIYTWAGSYRTVNISKDDFLFLLAPKIESEMERYECKQLARWTPCEALSDDELIRGLAVCHVELVLIHPFRDGNGRIARVLATVMALQAGHPPLDFTNLDQEKRRYIAAIHAGMEMNYEPMGVIFREILSNAKSG